VERSLQSLHFMGAALCGCLALVAVLVAYRHVRGVRQRAEAAETADQNALDRGLALLIKDISRHREAPREMIAPPPRQPISLPPRRPARGTPSDAVAVSARLGALAVVPTGFGDDEDAPTTIARVFVPRQ
jgi:hypothetical protein